MYNYNYDDEYNWERRPVRGRNPMATAAITLGIVSIVSCSAFYIALPCGALAVICAILSRDNRPMVGKSKAGIACGIAGMIATLIITLFSFRYVLFTEDGRAYLEYYYQMYTGDLDFDIDEALGQLFPFLYDSGNDNAEDPQSGSSGDNSDGYGNPGSGNDEFNDDGSGHGDSGHDGSGSQPNDSNNSADEGGFI
ncbi:MAG: hypothetical protein LUI13_07345 [Lachnospiraceae bacterium]|nr:hypothetical protein [Lachnospiraceae bacterium]